VMASTTVPIGVVLTQPADHWYWIEFGGRLTYEPTLRACRRALVASRRAEGSQGPGQGCVLKGTGSIVTSGEEMNRVKAKFP